MKNVLITWIALMSTTCGFGQDPDPQLFNTWYLTEIRADLSDSEFVQDVLPLITPFITIEASLDFYGEAACNGYGGTFVHDPVENSLILNDFFATQTECDFQRYNDFEATYFRYFPISFPMYYEVGGSGNEQFLTLEPFPGFELIYQNTQLSLEDKNLIDFSIYPNPASSMLYVISDNTRIETISIYSVTGKKILERPQTTAPIDVSSLPEGVYFIEVSIENEKAFQKFIKE